MNINKSRNYYHLSPCNVLILQYATDFWPLMNVGAHVLSTTTFKARLILSTKITFIDTKSELTSLLALGSAPWCNSSVTASMWPPAAANIKGVVPS